MMETASAPLPASSRDRTASWLGKGFLGLVLAYGLVVHLTNGVHPYDDGFIIYRYVDNLMAGNGLVYNIGARVFGASTPLYLFWLALLKLFARAVPTPSLAVYFNFLFYAASGVGLLLLLRQTIRSRWLAAVLAGLFLLRSNVLYVSTGGMESLMFLAFVFWAVWALAAGRFRLAGLLSGLSVLARPEGIFLCAVTFIAWLIADRRRPAAFLAGLLLPGLAWVAFGFAYYGNPVYHSITAKSKPLYPLPPGFALNDIWRAFKRWTSAGLLGNCMWLTIVLLAAAAAGYVLRSRLLRPRRNLIWPLLALTIVLILFYYTTNPLMFAWYFPLMEGLWFSFLAIGLVWLGSRLGRRRLWVRWIPIGLCLLLVAYGAIRRPVGRAVDGKSLFSLGIEEDKVRMRTDGYRDAALWLNKVLPEGVAVAGPEIGSLGYHYRGPIIDACGLVSPEVLPWLPVPIEERYHPNCGVMGKEMTRAIAPEVVVTIATFSNLSIYDDEWFKSSYRKVKEFLLGYELWGSKAVDVWFRRDHVEGM